MLRFIDSCQHYSTAQITRKWTSLNDAGANFDCTIESTGGRNNGYSILYVLTDGASASGSYLQKTIDLQQTWIIGFRYKISSLNLDANAIQRKILTIHDNTVQHLTFVLNTNGTIAVYRGDAATLLGTTSNSISAGIDYYLEFKFKIDNSAGTIDIKINGTSGLSLSSQDTQNAGTATANAFRFYGIRPNGITININWCDFYIADTQTGQVTDFLGDRRCDAYFYTADGNYQQWAESTGTTHYELVDDNPANDTDYITGEVGEKFTLKTTTMAHTPTVINGVALVGTMKKTDAGSINIQRLARQSAGDSNSSNLTAPGTDYSMVINLMEQNPRTSAAFTKTDIETDLELGFEVT